MKKQTKEEEYTLKLISHMSELFDDTSDCENHIELNDLKEDSNLTVFINCLANYMPLYFYSKFTGSKMDALEFNHVSNKLLFKYLK